MSEQTQVPEGGLRGKADRNAYVSGNFDLRAELPAAPPADGRVTWESGGSRVMRVTDARTAYDALERGSSGPGPRLTVTGAELGTMRVATSRGPATVPAWLFTLDGYDTPLKRAAVTPSKLPQTPVAPAEDVSTGELRSLGGLVEVADDGRAVTVMALHGSCDDGPAVDVLETGGSVVLSAYVRGTQDGPCAASLEAEEVVVRLAEPVGGRIVVDAFTGRPVPFEEPNARSMGLS
ncbi:hypothetical protein [Streptomyces sp. TRM68416]|uniref:hypothetical protein n=1 Tax=Streptomyces sp. TRM68416 TaxID=2758412 RepID=UPI001CB725AA|nr:hypothetical protein [Streptomyces sp. TRM68416]